MKKLLLWAFQRDGLTGVIAALIVWGPCWFGRHQWKDHWRPWNFDGFAVLTHKGHSYRCARCRIEMDRI